MDRFMVRLLTFSVLILLLSAPTVASAGTRETILRECQSGSITGNYTPGQLRDARTNIPTDIDEYSDCRDVIARASLAGRSSRSGGGTGGGGSTGGGKAVGAPGGVTPSGGEGAVVVPGNKEERKALKKARLSAPVAIGDEHIVPGASGFAADAARNGLPTTLLAVLILLGLCALAAAGPAVRRRVLPAVRHRVLARRQP